MSDPLDTGGAGLVASDSPAESAPSEALSRLRERSLSRALRGMVAQQPEPAPSGARGERGAGTVASEAHLGDLDLMAEHAASEIGFAALTGGIDGPARSLVGLGPSPEDGEGDSGAEAPPGPEDMEPSEQAGNPAAGNAVPAGPAPELPEESSAVPPAPRQDVPAPGTPATGSTDPAQPQDPVEDLKDKYLQSFPNPADAPSGRIQDLADRLHGKPVPGDTGTLLNPDETTRHMGVENQGGTRAWRNNNPGNLKKPGAGKMEDWANRFGAEIAGGGFLKFPSVEQGLAALQDLLSDSDDSPYKGLNVRDGIRKFAGLNDPGPDDPHYEAIHKANEKHLDDYLNTLNGFGVNADSSMLDQRDRVIPGIIQHEGYYAGIQDLLGT